MSDSSIILILDDGRCIVNRIGPALQRAGCTVLHFEDGEDAWARALKSRVDCFVIDAELPYSDDGLYFIEMACFRIQERLKPRSAELHPLKFAATATWLDASEPVRTSD